MSKILEKFLQTIKKLGKHSVIAQDDEHILVFPEIIICEHREQGGSLFQLPRESNIDKKIHVVFLVTSASKATDIDKVFMDNKMPLLSIDSKTKTSASDVDRLLNEFIANNFSY